MVCPTGTEKMQRKWMHWSLYRCCTMAFCFAFPVEKAYYNQLKLVEKLDDKLGTQKCILLIKKRNLQVENC
jgi:hypothetical protein